MVDTTPPTLTKDELVTEIQSLATDDWLVQNALDGTDRVAGCSVSALLDKYRFLCEAPLLAPSRVTVKTVRTISELVGVMSRAGLQAVQLLGACHTAFKKSIGNQDSAWQNTKLNSLLAMQLEDPLSVLTGALPDWCFVLVREAPCLFDASLRKKLFELSAFGVSATVEQIQSQLLHDLVRAHTLDFLLGYFVT